ncbi:hypothetical protein P9112_005903 [Eukaryota sp. TZLM1-RC]
MARSSSLFQRLLRLRQYNLKWPVFGLILLGYFLITSGIIYDQIVEPPSIGSERDPQTGAVKPVAVLPGRLNGQYVVEGFSAAFFMILGACGLILLDFASTSFRLSKTEQQSVIAAGGIFFLLAYNLLVVFLKKKVGGYLVYSD